MRLKGLNHLIDKCKSHFWAIFFSTWSAFNVAALKASIRLITVIIRLNPLPIKSPYLRSSFEQALPRIYCQMEDIEELQMFQKALKN